MHGHVNMKGGEKKDKGIEKEAGHQTYHSIQDEF
jgi:hypothetical protein